VLPAPLLAAAGRWAGVAGTRAAVRRITAVTVAFTVGHSATLVLGTLGLPVPQQPVEAAIAVSILVAAAHAVRPLFPGREPVVAGFFGLVHGMAFSTTLSSLDLSGGRLALSLLGFNLGIEIMQLAVVLLVLPPLVVLARTPAYPPLRTGAAAVTAVAAVGWLLDRIGIPNVLGTAADSLGTFLPWVVGVLWLAAAAVLVRTRFRLPPPAARSHRPAGEHSNR
jgi:HupE / UreJ protein